MSLPMYPPTHPATYLFFYPLPIYCGPRQVALAAAPGPCLKSTSIFASLPWRPATALPQCACCAGAANRDNARKGTRGARERAACVCARVWERVRDCGRTPQLGIVAVEQLAAAIIHRSVVNRLVRELQPTDVCVEWSEHNSLAGMHTDPHTDAQPNKRATAIHMRRRATWRVPPHASPEEAAHRATPEESKPPTVASMRAMAGSTHNAECGHACHSARACVYIPRAAAVAPLTTDCGFLPPLRASSCSKSNERRCGRCRRHR